MSEEKPKIPKNNLLTELVDFGPETRIPQSPVNERVAEIVKKLKELNARLDRLNSRYL